MTILIKPAFRLLLDDKNIRKKSIEVGLLAIRIETYIKDRLEKKKLESNNKSVEDVKSFLDK